MSRRPCTPRWELWYHQWLSCCWQRCPWWARLEIHSSTFMIMALTSLQVVAVTTCELVIRSSSKSSSVSHVLSPSSILLSHWKNCALLGGSAMPYIPEMLGVWNTRGPVASKTAVDTTWQAKLERENAPCTFSSSLSLMPWKLFGRCFVGWLCFDVKTEFLFSVFVFF